MSRQPLLLSLRPPLTRYSVVFCTPPEPPTFLLSQAAVSSNLLCLRMWLIHHSQPTEAAPSLETQDNRGVVPALLRVCMFPCLQFCICQHAHCSQISSQRTVHGIPLVQRPIIYPHPAICSIRNGTRVQVCTWV